MNAAVQLSFFPAPQDKLREAIRIVQTRGYPHAHYQRFVRSLAVAYKSASVGATIVGGCAGDITMDEVIGGFRRELKEFEVENHQAPVPLHIVRFSAPSCFTRKQFEEELISGYTFTMGSVGFGHRAQPRFQAEAAGDFFDSELLGALRARSPVGRLVALLKAKRPALVIVDHAENLTWANASTDEIRMAWKLVIDIARQSGIPHLIFAPVSTVNTVMGADDALRSSVCIEVLQPYVRANSTELISYRQTLAAYNGPLPWNTNDSLLKHLPEIDRLIHGDIARLRHWVVRAVTRALSERGTTHISWAHFYRTQPNEDQAGKAAVDKTAALSFMGPVPPALKSDPPPSDEKPPVTKLKPGVRKPGRDKRQSFDLAK